MDGQTIGPFSTAEIAVKLIPNKFTVSFKLDTFLKNKIFFFNAELTSKLKVLRWKRGILPFTRTL